MPDEVDVRKVDLSIELQILAFHEQRKASALRAFDRQRQSADLDLDVPAGVGVGGGRQ